MIDEGGNVGNSVALIFQENTVYLFVGQALSGKKIENGHV